MKKRNKILLSLVAAVSVAGITVTQTVLSKGHVPIAKLQVCHKGTTKTLMPNAFEGHLGHGDCQLPACDFGNVFLAGDSCPTASDAEGKCILENPRNSAVGLTPACTPY